MNNYSAYPVAAAEEQSRVKNIQKRIYAVVGAVSVAIAFILVGILAPVLVLQQRDTRMQEEASAVEAAASEYWVGVFRSAVVSTITVSYTLAGFVVGSMATLPPLNGTPEERVAGQAFPRFSDLAVLLNSSSEDLGLVATAPGGVVYQTYPDTPALYMYDMMYNYTKPLLGEEDLASTLDDGITMVLGPRRRNISEPAVGLRWDIDVMQPVYNLTPEFERNASNFWGFAYAILSLTSLVNDLDLAAGMQEAGLEFLMYSQDDADPRNPIVPIYTTLPDDTSQETLKGFIDAGEKRNILASKLDWALVVHKHVDVTHLSRTNVAIIASTVVGGTLLLLVIAIAIIFSMTKEYDGRRHAPKRPPFAIITVGPCHGNELWNLASEQMIEVTEKLNMVLNNMMVAHKAYPIVQLHPYTTSYITRTVNGAVRMAFGILEELQSRPIDANLCRLLGEDGKLLVSCAVHWCTDASVSIEPGGGAYRFEGPDVMFGGRMWFFAAPNTVTISHAANDARGPELADMKVVFFNSVYLRGVRGLQELFVITDPGSKRLKEAAAIAADRLARIRETHFRRLDQSKGSQSGQGRGDVGSSSGTSNAHAFSFRAASGNNINNPSVLAAAAAATAFLRTPTSTTLSSSSATEYLDDMMSASSSVISHQLEAQLLEGRAIIHRPSRRATHAAVVPRLDPNAALSSLPLAIQPQLVPFSSAAVSGPAAAMATGASNSARASGVGPSVSPSLAEEDGNPLADSFMTSGQLPPSVGASATSVSTPLSPDTGDAPEARASYVSRRRASFSSSPAFASNRTSPTGSSEGTTTKAASRARQPSSTIVPPSSAVGEPGSSMTNAANPFTSAGSSVRTTPTARTPPGPSGYEGGEAAQPQPPPPPPPLQALSSSLEGKAELAPSQAAPATVSSPFGAVSALHTGASATLVPATRPHIRGGGHPPLRIAVPAANPLVPPRDSIATSSSSNLSTPRVGPDSAPVGLGIGSTVPATSFASDSLAGSAINGLGGMTRVRGSPGAMSDGGSGAARGGGPSPPPGRMPSASFASQEATHAAAAAALLSTLYDDGPLGGHRFQSPTSTSASATGARASFTSASNGTSSHRVSAVSAGAAMPTSSDSGDRAGGGHTTDTTEANEDANEEEIADALLHPSIPVYLDIALRAAYERQALDLDISYDSVRVVVYYFFSCYKLLFRPLAAQERMNVYRRLMASFGVPQQSVLEHLAARCSLDYLKQHEEAKTFLMEPVTRPALETLKKRKKKKKH